MDLKESKEVIYGKVWRKEKEGGSYSIIIKKIKEVKTKKKKNYKIPKENIGGSIFAVVLGNDFLLFMIQKDNKKYNFINSPNRKASTQPRKQSTVKRQSTE